jgi:undecaprenyl diphosphate synthase
MNKLPRHIAIIMDGNGRWATKRYLPRLIGHRRGVETVRMVVRLCVEKKIPALTLFAFSSENWGRPKVEVKALMNLLLQLLTHEVKTMHENNIKLKVIGNLTVLNEELQNAIKRSELTTRENTGLCLNIALNYGGKWDITHALTNICADLEEKKINRKDISEKLIDKYMQLSDLPEPDLFIRTSGEQRISNFLLWQIAYAEIYFTPALWPDFNEADFKDALTFFANCERKFGKIAPSVSSHCEEHRSEAI